MDFRLLHLIATVINACDRPPGRRPAELSCGELQRFALLRALALDPVFLFADEPTSRLDPVTQQEVAMLLRASASEQGLGVLLVTHDAALARKLAHRVLELRSGALHDAAAEPAPGSDEGRRRSA